MMKTIPFVFLLVVWLQTATISAYTFKYAYDSAGNRVSRTLEVGSKKNKENTASLYYTESLASKEVRIYPNPTDGYLKVEIVGWDETNEYDMQIYSLDGIEVWSAKAADAITDIDLTNQKNGVYILLITSCGEKSTWKIIKK